MEWSNIAMSCKIGIRLKPRESMAPNKRVGATVKLNRMEMKRVIAALLLTVAPLLMLRADQTVEEVQQALKDQGFYYGQVTGEKNAETTAAIRRYQIRNGLQVTGELNEETLRSIKSNSSAASPSPSVPPPPPARGYASSRPDTSDLQDESGARPENDSETPVPAQPFVTQPLERGPMPPKDDLFAGTPYANAPVQVQRRVITDAQRLLSQAGLYKNDIDGIYGPGLEFSLRAYQSRIGLQVSGRLDLETLAALQLLPGSRSPVFVPRRRRFPPGPPVRGEWVRP